MTYLRALRSCCDSIFFCSLSRLWKQMSHAMYVYHAAIHFCVSPIKGRNETVLLCRTCCAICLMSSITTLPFVLSIRLLQPILFFSVISKSNKKPLDEVKPGVTKAQYTHKITDMNFVARINFCEEYWFEINYLMVSASQHNAEVTRLVSVEYQCEESNSLAPMQYSIRKIETKNILKRNMEYYLFLLDSITNSNMNCSKSRCQHENLKW